MPQHIKALIVVIFITALMFILIRPLMRRFMNERDFAVRRNVWLGLTLAAFLIPNYWGYVGVAAIMLAFAVKHDSNPAALYVFLLLAMVPLGLDVPTFGLVRQLVFFDHFQILAFVVLLPAAWKLLQSPSTYDQSSSTGDRTRKWADALILLYLALQVVLVFPHESITASMRRVVVSGLGVWLPYFVISRSCRTRESLVEVMAALALAMFVLTPLAVFEVAKGWLLYAGLQEQWGTAQIMGYLRRGDYLRAQTTAGHSIVLGYAMTIAFGFWLFLQSRVLSGRWRALAMVTILVGMLMPSARGPWLGAMLIVLVFLSLGPNRGGRILKFAGLVALLSGIVVASPYGDQVIERLPFIGTLDEGTVAYRQQLAAVSWLLIEQNPWFGTPGFLEHLEFLKQGQGIVDLVNAFAGIALAYGVVTLAAFAGFFSLIVVACVGVLRGSANRDPDLTLIGASLVACLIGSLFMLATVNLYLSVANLMWSLAGLGVAYVQLARNPARDTVDAPPKAEDEIAVWPRPGWARRTRGT